MDLHLSEHVCCMWQGMHPSLMSSAPQLESVVLRIRKIAHTLLGAAFPDDQPLLEAGLDSLGALELQSSVGQAFHMQLPATTIFDHPTVHALSKYVYTQVALNNTSAGNELILLLHVHQRLQLRINNPNQ